MNLPNGNTKVARVAPSNSVTAATTPMELLQLAMAQGADVDKLKQLLDLQDRWMAGQARSAFVVAMAAFKAEPTAIFKTRRVAIPGGANFSHATLAQVVDAVCVSLSRHGLSHRWEIAQEANSIVVSCVITHIDGHSERTTMSAPADDSGRKNPVQQIASTVSYLERYTLLAATGLAARDMDNDGRGAPEKKQEEVNAPEGFDKWQADMSACADSGEGALKSAWEKSPADFRVLATAGDRTWWEATKLKAKSVKI